ncbi:DUF6896 domain-containing protein [Saccharopolyspora sp. MS10]|uniref:DUF6896 domain-containing protein n=1 Tax=Saccharopolyspora sp. MS10 TaxID=3385973 RepID=UPI00399FE335
MRPVDVVEGVRAYLDAVDAGTREIVSPCPGAANLRDVVELAMEKKIRRKGRLGSGVEYSIHGVGCLFVGVNGAEADVDVDFFDDGARVFDVWRLSMFFETSGGGISPGSERIQESCAELIDRGVLQSRGRWYTADIS